ncbi:serine/threonine-protein kinase [Luteimonas cucumeris]|uniref:Serine/threonine-protein kinase n=1 Tax=Luteimonas cucumeris TaxID=985012 RepID=A0A562LER0_9GAMM|nr:serine/threonine-protein kinase [Luteimonas cucumeris]TWI06101.1 serine/threonine-protein kinase [Luteimonas cucumeris]
MDAETLAQWRTADALFDQWLDLVEGERDAWLAAQNLSVDVRRRLEQLVAAHRHPRAALDPLAGNLTGCRLGGWTLDSELGRGGMAVVYRGWREQGMARQQAAIKILTLGALGASGRERFQREAGILARLNHPHITALVDSGVADDGTCWLAMPLVEGERIDRWCESNSPDARAIVRLYLQVCDAVACAHRNLVIHRDLKPSNVLVDSRGHVHLLDFGIGQFADADTEGNERTQTMWRAMTPGYAAPEQLRGEPPSTAIDVYGLGALLHRLLTGRTPQAATEGADTTRPSLLVRNADDAYHRHYVPLKNDLDRVLLKALAEEPEQRYPSAEALADDLRRWLDGQPVLAQKPRLGYRARKFVMRNKLGVAAACLLVASLAGGVGATLWQAGEARRAADDALKQSRRATAARDFMTQLFEANDPNVAQGRTISARELLDQGALRVRDAFADTPVLRAEMLVLLGDLYRRMGEPDAAAPLLDEGLALAGTTGDPNLTLEARFAKGLLDAAASRPTDALEQFAVVERMLESAGRVPGELHGQLVMHQADALSATGQVPAAVAHAETALSLARNDASMAQESLFFYLRALSAVLATAGQDQRAETLLNEALALRGVDKLAPTVRLPVHSHLADFALARGELETALRESGAALELAQRVYLPASPVRAALLNGHGGILTHMARFDDAVAAIGGAISILDALHPDGLDSALANACNSMALALDNAERDREAEPYMIRARNLSIELFGREDPRYAIATANLGNLYRQMGRYTEAETLLAEGLRLRRKLLGEAHPFVGHGLIQVARLRLLQQRPAEALRLAEQASDIYAKADYKDPRRLASTDGVRATAMAALGRVPEAVALFDRTITEARDAGVDNGVEWPRVMAARAELFIAHLPARARAALADALDAHRRIYGDDHPGTKRMIALAATIR